VLARRQPLLLPLGLKDGRGAEIEIKSQPVIASAFGQLRLVVIQKGAPQRTRIRSFPATLEQGGPVFDAGPTQAVEDILEGARAAAARGKRFDTGSLLPDRH
jgi:hypothetical protein